MDISHEFIRREARDLETAPRQAMRNDRATLDHLVSEGGAGRTTALVGGINRRQVLLFGGAGVAMTAVIAACKGATPSPSAVPATTTSTAINGSTTDVALLRTASSIEALAVSAYTTALKTGLVTTTTTSDLLKLFQSQHSQHGDLFQRSTRTAG